MTPGIRTQAESVVSVVVPIRDAESHVGPLLDALLAQELSCGDLEIVAVDNGSQDGTWRRLCEIQSRSHVRLTLVQENRIACSYLARNTGICAARGRILAFTDADCRPRPDWLRRLIEGFRSSKIGLVAGEIEAAPGDTWVEGYCTRWGMLSQRFALSHPHAPYAQTASLAVRRAVFVDVGLFRSNMTSGGDADLCWRATAAGWKLEFAPGATIMHHHRTTLRDLWSQWKRYGGGQEHLRQLHGVPAISLLSGAQLLVSLSRSMGRSLPVGLPTAGDIPLALLCWAAFQAGRLSQREWFDAPAAEQIPIFNDFGVQYMANSTGDPSV
jgi:GT2 family glycosyltransferase